MPEYLAPGVFVEEIDGGSKPIEGVGVNTAAFIGYAKSGEFNKPTFISNWTQFCQTFGEEENAIVKALATELGKSAAEIVSAKRASRKSWMEFARAEILKAVDERKKPGKADPKKVADWPQFLSTYSIPLADTPYIEGSYLAHAVRGYYDNGGGRAYIVRIARADDLEALSTDTPAGAAPPEPKPTMIGGLAYKALKSAPGGEGPKVVIDAPGEGDEFKATITLGDTTETFPAGKDKLTPATAPDVLKKSRLVSVESVATATATRPATGEYVVTGTTALTTTGTGTALTPMAADFKRSLARVKPDDWIGSEATRTGTGGLSVFEDINMIAMPDLMAGVFQRERVPGSADGVEQEVLALTDERKQEILDIQCNLVAYCERSGDRMAILDPIPGLTPDDMRAQTLDTPYNCDHGQAAIYYPWIKIVDPNRKGKQLFVPPSGHVAGVWARVGVERGVHKAPANEALLGAVDLEVKVTKGEQEILNPNGVNCIRSFPGTGIRVWGARTLATVGNPSWKYVNVRRLFNYLEKSMERGMQWVVFEPNDEDLWGRVRRNLAAFLWTEWKEGKLFGSTPAEAFYVKCDAETNPQEMIDLGRLYVEIGVNPVKPAEFVIIRIGQWSSGGAMVEQ